ncbi:MAG: sugar-binding domain-containing protein [Oscillospiraceae bacterium]
MVRDSYLNLNGPWSYAITTSANKPAQADGTILVPFSPESELSGVGHVLQPEEYLWYIRTVTLPDGFNVGRVLLHFGAVDQTATVWCNGVELATHTGGYLPFTVDITGCWPRKTRSLCACATRRTSPSSRAASRRCTRTASGTRRRAASGRRSGSRACRRTTSAPCT